MRNLPIIIGIAAVAVFASHPLPICEEFNGEDHIHCVSTEKAAVIISQFEDGSRQYEFYTADGGKGYIYLDGGVYASTAKRQLNLPTIPVEDTDAYIREIIEAVTDDIGWD
jgi:hypothetical protein